MSVTLKSSAVLKNSRARPDSQYEAEEATFSIVLPVGYSPASGDVFVFGILGENVQLQQISYDFPAYLDTSASPTLAMKSGYVTYAGAGNTQAYTGISAGPFSGSEISIVNTAVVVNGANGTNKNIARLDGENTALDSFTTPYQAQASQQLLVASFTAGAATAGTVGSGSLTFGATINCSAKFQYAYPDSFVSGVTGVSPSNLLGTKASSQAVTYQYGPGASPNAP